MEDTVGNHHPYPRLFKDNDLLIGKINFCKSSPDNADASGVYGVETLGYNRE